MNTSVASVAVLTVAVVAFLGGMMMPREFADPSRSEWLLTVAAFSIFAWMVVSALVGAEALARNRRSAVWFALSMLISPPLALLLLLAIGPGQAVLRCPDCGRAVTPDATVCASCGASLFDSTFNESHSVGGPIPEARSTPAAPAAELSTGQGTKSDVTASPNEPAQVRQDERPSSGIGVAGAVITAGLGVVAGLSLAAMAISISTSTAKPVDALATGAAADPARLTPFERGQLVVGCFQAAATANQEVAIFSSVRAQCLAAVEKIP